MVVRLHDCSPSRLLPFIQVCKCSKPKDHQIKSSWTAHAEFFLVVFLLLRVIPTCVCWFYPLAQIPAMEHPGFVQWFYSWTLGSCSQAEVPEDPEGRSNVQSPQGPVAVSHRVLKDLTRIHPYPHHQPGTDSKASRGVWPLGGLNHEFMPYGLGGPYWMAGAQWSKERIWNIFVGMPCPTENDQARGK